MKTPQQVYDENRLLTWQDMWDYSPYLKEIARGNILEIGTRDGVSTAAFLLGVEKNGGHVYSVDIHPDCANLYDHAQWTFILANSGLQHREVMSKVDGWLDVLLIDGDHSYGAICRDVANYVQYVRRGGLILMHDVDLSAGAAAAARQHKWFVPEEPRRVFNEFTAENPTWPAEIKKGQFGLGVIVKGE